MLVLVSAGTVGQFGSPTVEGTATAIVSARVSLAKIVYAVVSIVISGNGGFTKMVAVLVTG
jgi:hypothetical protein